jgi:DNA-binding SARP family transcriptional activator
VRVVVNLAHYWQHSDEAERAIDLLEMAIELDASSEGIYRNLMECYTALGRRAEAVDTYGRCRKMLAATLQVDPSPETTALYEKLTQAT